MIWSIDLLVKMHFTEKMTYLNRIVIVLLELLTNPNGLSYGVAMGWVECNLSFSLLRSAIMCIRGTRSSCIFALTCHWGSNCCTGCRGSYLSCLMWSYAVLLEDIDLFLLFISSNCQGWICCYCYKDLQWPALKVWQQPVLQPLDSPNLANWNWTPYCIWPSTA